MRQACRWCWVTMPAPEKIVIAGSGGVAAQGIATKGEVVIAGSGRLDIAHADADELDVNVVGSGMFGAAGKARKLDLTVAGAGSMEAPGLVVDEADIDGVAEPFAFVFEDIDHTAYLALASRNGNEVEAIADSD